MTRFFGKYRGTVENNIDPQQMGRIQVSVPAVLGEGRFSWAMPCVPFAGSGMGVYVVPDVGAHVWVEFEGGDPNYPIWAGGFWATPAGIPGDAIIGIPAQPNIVLNSSAGHTVVLNNMPGPLGGITLKIASGASISINDTGITISNGQGAEISLIGPTVTINQGALAIT